MARPAFTLLEVSLVAALIVLLAMMAYPSIEAIYGDVRLTAAADQIQARWADARTHAIENGRPYRFSVIPTTGKFRVAPDAEEFWSGGEPGGDEDADSPPLVLEESLPSGVKFADAQASDSGGDGSGEWNTLVRFDPDGTANKDVEISFTTTGVRTLVLKLKGLTGSVTKQTRNAGK